MNDLEPVPLAALEHYAYCPRQCALIHVDGLWADNRFTIAGHYGHRRADSSAHRAERGRRVLRSIPLWSELLGLTGRADIVEVWPDGSVVPVEYKVGRRHGQTADVQLCAQAMCLEEMGGAPVPEGFVWYTQPHRRERVVFDAALRTATVHLIEVIRAMILDATLPPAIDDARCQNCQLAPHCLPEVCAHDSASLDRFVQEVMAP